MSITILGYILITFGLLLFFFAPNQLICSVVFFMGWNGSSVINFGDTGLQPSYFLSIIWFLSFVLRNRGTIKIGVLNKIKYIYLFLIVACISLLFIPVFANRIDVYNIDAVYGKLTLSTNNITQLIYLIFSVLFLSVFFIYLKQHKDKRGLLIKVYLYGAISVSLIAIYQYIALRVGLPFDNIFRTNPHCVDWLMRISGPCLEASMLCYYLVSTLPFFVRTKNKAVKYIGLLLVFSAGIMSLSSTFILGFIVWTLLEAFFYLRKTDKFHINKTELIILMTLFGVGTVFLVSNNQIIDLIINNINELSLKIKGVDIGGSGAERLSVMTKNFQTFLDTCLLGAGWGSCRSTDLFTTVLANVGLAGIFCLLFAIIHGLRNAVRISNYDVLTANIIIWCCMFVSVSEMYNLFVWFLFAFMYLDTKIKDY